MAELKKRNIVKDMLSDGLLKPRDDDFVDDLDDIESDMSIEELFLQEGVIVASVDRF